MARRQIAWSLIPVVVFLVGCQAKQGKEAEHAEPPGSPAPKVEAVQPAEGVTSPEAVPPSVTDEKQQQGSELPSESSATSSQAIQSQRSGEVSRTAMKPANGPYWPRFHGPRGDNISDDTGLLESWPTDGPPLVWKVEGIGRGYASVTIADGRIFTAGDIDNKLIITAMDMDGEILWQKPNGPAWTKNYPGSRGTPTIDGDRVYHLGASGDLACFQVTDGKEIWRRNIMEDFHAPLPEWALAESVLVDERCVYCTPGGPETCVVALDKMTGELIWKSESAEGDTTGYASILRAEFEGMPILLTMTAKAVVGVRADTGKLLFRHPHETEYDVNACMPLYADGVVVVSTGYGSGAEAIRLTRQGETIAVQQVWSNRELDNHHGGILALNGFVYGASYNGRWLCLGWENGATRYADKGVGKGSLTYADGMLYTFSERKMVGLVKADPEKHELVSSFRIPSDERDPSWAHPVVCGGRLYLRHGNLLFAYDVRKQP